MKTYIGVKVVKAEPMTYHEAGKLGLIRDYDPNGENMEGYKVVYEDGYVSWSPKNVFDRHYRELTNEEVDRLSELTKNCERLLDKVAIVLIDN